MKDPGHVGGVIMLLSLAAVACLGGFISPVWALLIVAAGVTVGAVLALRN